MASGTVITSCLMAGTTEHTLALFMADTGSTKYAPRLKAHRNCVRTCSSARNRSTDSRLRRSS